MDPETEKQVDSVIERLLAVRGNKPGKATQVISRIPPPPVGLLQQRPSAARRAWTTRFCSLCLTHSKTGEQWARNAPAGSPDRPVAHF